MRFSSTVLTVMARAVALLAALIGASGQAHAFTHPCIPSTTQDLDYIKANLNREPWKSGYAQLLASWNPNYTPQPYATVSRSPNVNLTAWSRDMSTVCDYARLWYFTGNNAYAQKAHDILLAWANTQTFMGGNEAGLALGDVAMAYGGGASILRGTWPGWTEADTAAVKNLFANVYWPATASVGHLVGPANKGSLNMMAGMAIALFCDDTDKFNHVLDLYRTYPGSGLANTLPTGEMGETGRDAGHAYGDLLGKVFVAECAWKQGIDLYSEWDNRLLAVGEYYCRNTYIFDNPFVDFGTIDYLYVTNAKGPYTANRAAFYLIQNAYKNRKGLPTPWIDKKMQEQSLDGGNFVFAKTVDFTTATPPAAIVRPAVSLASSGLTLTTLGTNSAGRSCSYANGVWTMTGAGVDVWGDTADDCQFAYQQMTGDCAIVARVTSSQLINGATKAGVMIRDNLSAAVSQRGYAAVIPNTPTQVQSRLAGDTERWAGRVAQATNLPDPGMPYWVKVERRGLMLTAYTSPDGTSWSPNVSNYFANLPSTLYIGLFIVSGSATTTTTATFDHVAFTGGTGGLVTTPAAPARLLAVGSSKAITLRWLPSFDATAYDVLRSGTSGSGYTVIASNLPADKTSYMDTTPAAGATYYYVVQAKNSAGASGNSPEFYGSLLPPPLVNLAFSGAANDSSNNPVNAASAFDQNPGTQWFYTGTTGWLQYDFGANNAQLIKRYTVTEAITIPARDPKDWQFQGSQDGSTWTTLDTQSGQTFAYTYQQLTYDIANTTAYRYYRINVTANNGDATFLHVGELGLWGDVGRTVPDGTCVIASRNTNKVMDVTGTANGSQVVQQTFAGDDTQQWNIAWQGNGVYRATNVAATKVIDNGGTSSVGANLVIQPSTGGTSQLWTVIPDSDGFYRITSANSGLVTAVSGGSTADGANIVQGTYTGGDSQLWMPGGAVAPQPTPPAPVLTATAASISQIDLSWTAGPGAIHYNIKRSDVSGGPYTTVAAEVSGTSYSDTYLTSGTTYYYVVSALNGSGEGANSAQVQATTLTGVPPAPTGISEILGTNRIVLNWTATGGATSYTVKRATSVSGPYTTLASGLTSPTYTDTSRTTDVAYYYIVIAVNAFGSSSDSAPVTVAPGTLSVLLKFDETGGAIAADSSGGGHDATLVNNPAFVAGLLDNALNLPGTATQYAKLPSGIMSGLTDFTIASWIKVNSFATWQRIFDLGTSTSNYMYLTPQYTATAPNAAKLRFTIRTPSIGEQSVNGNGIALVAGAWTHVAVTRSGNTVSLYVNGALAGSGTVTISPSDLGVTTQNYLGKSQFGNDPYLNAALDEFRLYAHAMTPAEITALTQPPAGAPRQLAALPGNTLATLAWAPNATTTYTIKRSGTSGGPYTTVADGVTSTTYTDTGLTNGVTYYYVIGGANSGGPGPDSAEIAVTPGSLNLHLKFDETSGSTAADSSGNNRNGTTFNSPIWTAGRLGNALGLDGVNQYGGLPSGIVSGLNDFTVATWVYWNGGNNSQRIFDFGTGTNKYMELCPKTSNGYMRYEILSGGTVQQINTTCTFPTGVWTHVALTQSGSTGTLYINGTPVGTNAGLTLKPSNLGTTTLNYVGRSQWSIDPYLNGSVDNFRLYSTGLSASSIALLANPMQTTGLTATGGSGQIALAWDSTLNATSYTVRRASTSGTAYSTLASNVTDTNYTDTGLADGTTYYYVITPANLSGEGANSGEVSALTLPAAPANVTATASNGQVLISWSASATADSYDVLRATSIGGPYTTLASGLIVTDYTDTTAIPGRTYYYAVAAVNSSGPNQSASATVTMPTIAVCWLQLDETSGTIATDASGNNNFGTLVNGPAWITGRIGNALTLNGGTQHATLPSGVVSGLSDFTITTWVKVSGTSKNTRIFDFGTGTNNYMELCPKTSSNGYMRYEIVSGGTVQQINTTCTFPTGVWTHVALTQSGSTGTLYINGTSVGTNAGLTLKPSNLGTTTLNYVGRSQWSNDPYLNGALDDFRIYSGAFSAGAISALATPLQASGLAAAAGAEQIALAWNSTLNATSYTVRRSVVSGGPYLTLASGVTGTSYTDTGLTAGTTFYYVITAANASGDGPNSNETSGTALTPLEAWRLTYFGTTSGQGNAADAADPDGDGMTNATEFASGTNPTDRTSLLKIAQIQASGNDLIISFPSVSGKTYRLERSDTLQSGSWTTVLDNIAGTGRIVQITDPGAAAQFKRFYRIVIP